MSKDNRTPPADGGTEGLQAIVAAYSRLIMAQAEALAALSPNGSTTIKVDAAMVALRAALAGLPSRTPAGAADAILAARPVADLSEQQLAEVRTWLDGSFGPTCKKIAEALLTAK
jgi:hypothetical protein